MKKLLVVIILVVSAGAAMAQSKIAHVNSQALLDTLPSRKVAIKKLQQFEADGIKELQAMQLDYQTALNKYKADVAAVTLTPVMRQIAEEKLIKKEEALQDRDQSLQAEMQAYSNELNAPILKMLQDAVKIVSDRKKIDYVIDVSVALIANGEDLTKEVIVELLKLDAAAMK